MSDFIDYVEGQEVVKANLDPGYSNVFRQASDIFLDNVSVGLGAASVRAPGPWGIGLGIAAAITGYATRSRGSSACRNSQHAAGFAGDASGLMVTAIRWGTRASRAIRVASGGVGYATVAASRLIPKRC